MTQDRDTTRLLLVRHGEAHVNLIRAGAASQLQDVHGLTDLGRAQAGALRDRVRTNRTLQPDVIVSSTYPRAAQTAQIVAEAQGIAIESVDELQEWRIGEGSDNYTIEDLTQHWSLLQSGNAMFAADFGSAESYGQFAIRVGAAITDLVERHQGKTVMTFTHGGVIEVSMTGLAYGGWLVPPSQTYRIGHTGVTEWVATHDEGPLQWQLRRFNDQTHLE